MRALDLAALARAALPVVAGTVFIVFLAMTLAVAGDTLGYDFLAYHQAARRVLDDQPLYDMSVQSVGEFGLFFYPPAFVPLVLPLGLLDGTTATWVWMGLLVVAFLVGVAILPVSRPIRWLIVLLAGLSWPFQYAIKLGQVSPLLFLLFAIAWRWLDSPGRTGAALALATAIKVQPAILLGWLVLMRRWSAVLVAGAVLLVLAALAIVLTGPHTWSEFVTLMTRISNALDLERNMSIGAVLYRMGVPLGVAGVVGFVAVVAVVFIGVVAVTRTTAEASFLVAVVASQLLSPILWEHYAVLLLLPVAYLLSAGAAWAVLIPLATMVPLLGITPPIVYPVAFYVALIATLVVGARRPRPLPASGGVFA